MHNLDIFRLDCSDCTCIYYTRDESATMTLSKPVEHEIVLPVFFKHKDYSDQMRIIGHNTDLTPYTVCRAVEKSLGPQSVLGAQNIRGMWRIYLKQPSLKVELLVKGELKLREAKVTLYEQNPYVTKMKLPTTPREKVTIKDLPLSVSNEEIVKFLTSKSIVAVTPVKDAKERDQDGKLTDYKNGDRFVYCVGPIEPCLPRSIRISDFQCRVFHDSQYSGNCKACDKPGHKAGDLTCIAYNKDDNVTCFQGHLFPLSNMFSYKIKVFGKYFKSVEHAYQWWVADAHDCTELASRIMNAEHAGVAKRLSKDIPTENDTEHDIEKRINTMRHLINLKRVQCPAFREALLDTKPIIAEATPNRFWGCGLHPKLAKMTKPDYYPGHNMLGKILMDERSKAQTQLNADKPKAPTNQVVTTPDAGQRKHSSDSVTPTSTPELATEDAHEQAESEVQGTEANSSSIISVPTKEENKGGEPEPQQQDDHSAENVHAHADFFALRGRPDTRQVAQRRYASLSATRISISQTDLTTPSKPTTIDHGKRKHLSGSPEDFQLAKSVRVAEPQDVG